MLLRALDEREDVAHAEDPLRQPVGMEDLDRVELLAGADELDRNTRHGAHRERCAPARVAIRFRQHESRERKARVEDRRALHRVLARHRVHHE